MELKHEMLTLKINEVEDQTKNQSLDPSIHKYNFLFKTILI